MFPSARMPNHQKTKKADLKTMVNKEVSHTRTERIIRCISISHTYLNAEEYVTTSKSHTNSWRAS